MFEFLKKIFGGESAGSPAPDGRFGVDELCRRLALSRQQLETVRISYTKYEIIKRSGNGTRTILAPDPALKAIQRTILKRLLARLKAHLNAHGFEVGQSIVTNAVPHVGQDVVVRLDLKEFFASTKAARVEAYFRQIGWNAEAAKLLTKLCTHDGSLPQGAPTSPRLSNLVNVRMDERLMNLAYKRGFNYTRYADDITFSGENPRRINDLIRATKEIVADDGYQLHTDRKLRISRRHDRQLVTGIVVNDIPNLPRETRRWLRAVEHRLKTTGQATLTQKQLDGWRALQRMVVSQSAP